MVSADTQIDFVIEQIIMCCLKSNVGPKQGTCNKGTQGRIRLLSMPTSSTFELKMQELINLHF